MGIDVQAVLTLASYGVAAWFGTLVLLFCIFGVNPWRMLDEIELPEAVFFAGWGFASAYLVAQLFSRFA